MKAKVIYHNWECDAVASNQWEAKRICQSIFKKRYKIHEKQQVILVGKIIKLEVVL